jgi:hypothetical protein
MGLWEWGIPRQVGIKDGKSAIYTPEHRNCRTVEGVEVCSELGKKI